MHRLLGSESMRRQAREIQPRASRVRGSAHHIQRLLSRDCPLGDSASSDRRPALAVRGCEQQRLSVVVVNLALTDHPRTNHAMTLVERDNLAARNLSRGVVKDHAVFIKSCIASYSMRAHLYEDA